MKFLTLGYWSDLWTDMHCWMLGHIWGPWKDGHNGLYWRSCVDCHAEQSKPYIDLLIETRKLNRDEATRP